MGRRPPCGLRPLAWSTEKQVTPATEPPLITQAELSVENGNSKELHTGLELGGV
jgi:hypothetical protein